MAPRLEYLAGRDDSVGFYIRDFRTNHNSGTWFMLVGTLAASIGAALLYETPDYDAFAIGGLAIGVALVIPGGIKLRRSENSLQRAIWFYNRSLPRP